jgi:hypothetical protein
MMEFPDNLRFAIQFNLEVGIAGVNVSLADGG